MVNYQEEGLKIGIVSIMEIVSGILSNERKLKNYTFTDNIKKNLENKGFTVEYDKEGICKISFEPHILIKDIIMNKFSNLK